MKEVLIVNGNAMKFVFLAVGLLLLFGCVAPRPPQQAPSRELQPVTTSRSELSSAPMTQAAEALPEWLLHPAPRAATGCAPIGPDALRVATVKAKAELIRQRRAEVAATMAMRAGAFRSAGRAAARSEWTERVEMSSAGVVEGAAVLQVEEIVWEGRRQLCVRIGPDDIREKEEAHERK